MQERLSELTASVNALIAVGLALKAKFRREPYDKDLAEQIENVLDELGISASIEALNQSQATAMLVNIRGDLLLGVGMLSDDRAKSEWAHENADLLQTFGDVSAGFPVVLKSKIAPQFDGLSALLESPGTRFLDIGTGVGELSIAMVKQWPTLEVVGVEPWEPSLAIGLQNVRAAGYSDQIELRMARAEALEETDEFNLAWVPSAFIPRQSLPDVLASVRQALKPGGWLMLARPHHSDDPLARVTTHFRTVLWGGGPLSERDAENLLDKAGLTDARSATMPPGAPIAVTIARRS